MDDLSEQEKPVGKNLVITGTQGFGGLFFIKDNVTKQKRQKDFGSTNLNMYIFKHLRDYS